MAPPPRSSRQPSALLCLPTSPTNAVLVQLQATTQAGDKRHVSQPSSSSSSTAHTPRVNLPVFYPRIESYLLGAVSGVLLCMPIYCSNESFNADKAVGNHDDYDDVDDDENDGKNQQSTRWHNDSAAAHDNKSTSNDYRGFFFSLFASV
ncbi:hypothetical protein ACTXT7_013994 [Hymenolepis weldensis]